MRHNPSLSAALALIFIAALGNGQALAAGRPALALESMLKDGAPEMIDNRQFVAPEGAAKATAPFMGVLKLVEIEMSTSPAEFKSRQVMGKDPKIFPAAELGFFTVGDDLVPVNQEVLRYGSTPKGRAFWDIIVQPGRVWSEPGDDGWNRASFPFSLMHSVEGETHNGVAMFLYKEGRVSKLHFQVVQQTAPFYIEDYFTAWGAVPAAFSPETPRNLAELTATWEAAKKADLPLNPWSDLEALVGADALAKFDTDLKPEELVADGLFYKGKFYLKSMPSPAGPLPYPDRQRFGVWSVTKTLVNTVGMLRLAEKFGPEVFKLKVVDYITEFKGVKGWEPVTFGDLLNMASGTGRGDPKPEPPNINTGQIDDYYAAWYEAPSAAAKIAAMRAETQFYSWGPGQVARYRDHDHFLLGVAMDRYLKAREGPQADIGNMIVEEVYKPIGIYYAPMNRTVEAAGPGAPLMPYGDYPTIGDMVKIGRLFQNNGQADGRQILNAQALADILPGTAPRGLPTGSPDVGAFYHKGTWQAAYQAADGQEAFYTVMRGWGGNYVLLFPDHVLAVRIAKNWDGDRSSATTASLAEVALGLAGK